MLSEPGDCLDSRAAKMGLSPSEIQRTSVFMSETKIMVPVLPTCRVLCVRVLVVGLACFSVLFLSAVKAPGAGTERDLAEGTLEATGVQGGLVVHLGCGDGKLTAALAGGENFLVQGLDADAADVARARDHIRSLSLYGRVSADRLDGDRLPYIDNCVNLLVAEDLGGVTMDEVMRVLVPRGVALVSGAKGQGSGVRGRGSGARGQEGERIEIEGRIWKKTVKPRPKEIDDWTHYLYDASNNAVSKDMLVDMPGRLQWVGSPPWSRHHDHMASTSAIVSAAGRVFYIFDEGPTASILLPSQWSLVARDAFNGVILWKRSIPQWHTQMFRLKSGPSQLPRRLVAIDDVVYVTLGLDAPLAALDATTGNTLRTYEGTRATEEVISCDGLLVLVTADEPFQQPTHPEKLLYDWPESARNVMAVEAESGEVLWKHEFPWVVPLTLAADTKRVYFHDGEKIVCLDRQSGEQVWSSPPVERKKPLPSYYAPTLVVHDGVVLFTGGANLVPHRGADDTMTAYSAETGKELWTAPHPPSGYQSPEDILVADGLVWTGAVAAAEHSGHFTGRDLLTGEVKRDFPPDVPQRYGHHRCYRAKATERYLLTSRNGIELLDVRDLRWETTRWIRGGCLYGIMPANGLIYTPPHDCACNIEAKLYGFCAVAPQRDGGPGSRDDEQEARDEESEATRLERGPAYDVIAPTSHLRPPTSDDWPTYRRDAQRSGFTPTSVPPNLKESWQTDLGGRLTPPVIAEGRLFVASVDCHSVHALDADSGQVLWSYTTGGRVDSPPTIDRGRVLFGSADGCVYCLRASDGALAWRFRAAPDDRRFVAWEQLESVWPVHGSVLVEEGVVWCACGRSRHLDGGLSLLRLDAAAGRKLSETRIDPTKGRMGLPDILSCDGRRVYMRSQAFDLEGNPVNIAGAMDIQKQAGEGAHLFCPTGFLDGSWWHRSYWVYGRSFASGATGYPMAGRFAPTGKVMVFDDTTIYGYTRKPQYFRWTTPLERHLFASSKEPEILRTPRKPAKAAAKKTAAETKRRVSKMQILSRETRDAKIAHQWTQDLPLVVRAMVLAKDTLFVAGPPDVMDEVESLATYDQPDTQELLARQAAALEGKEGSLLWAVSTTGGKELAEHRIEGLPVFDGMAAAGGNLFLSTADGTVLCLGKSRP